jgi:hypothetical protein
MALAMLAGVLYALAANVVSYFADRIRKTGQPLSQKQQLAIDVGAFCTFVVGGLISTAAYAMGDPVPFLQGTLVATNLLLNMVLQVCLRISLYTKSMRIGTILVFVVVVFQLAYVGPEPRPTDINAMDYFSKTSAILWFLALGSCTIVASFGVYYTRNASTDSFTKIFLWALLIAAIGSGTDNAASTFGNISGFVLYAALVAYALVSVVVLLLSSKAPALCDANTYVPLQLSLQLFLNMITGLLVWQDNDRMQGKPLQPYFATFVVIVLGVYVASPSADLVEEMVRWRIFRKTKLSEEIASSTFGRAVLAMVASWHHLQAAPGKQSNDAAREALQHALSVGAERGRLTSQDMVDLAVALYGDRGSFAASATFMKWLENNSYCKAYLTYDPSFREQLLSLLPESERTQLLSFSMHQGTPSELTAELTAGSSTSFVPHPNNC